MTHNKISQNDIICHYIDHSEIDTFMMATLSKKFKSELLKRVNLHECLILTTCHRIEIYSTNRCRLDLPTFFNLSTKKINGVTDVLYRMVEIGCGLKSKILGERSIYFQLQNALFPLFDKNPFLFLGSKALNIANILRTKYNFFAINDYEQIVINSFSNNNGMRRPDSLLIIGGGMLGKKIAESEIQNMYKQVVIVTRNPKKVKKSIANTVKAYSYDMIPRKIFNSPYHSFIATDYCSEVYKKKIIGIFENNSNIKTIDLSAIPLRNKFDPMDDNYITMYSKTYMKEVKKNNELLMDKIKPLSHEARELVDDYAVKTMRTKEDVK